MQYGLKIQSCSYITSIYIGSRSAPRIFGSFPTRLSRATSGTVPSLSKPIPTATSISLDQTNDYISKNLDALYSDPKYANERKQAEISMINFVANLSKTSAASYATDAIRKMAEKFQSNINTQPMFKLLTTSIAAEEKNFLSMKKKRSEFERMIKSQKLTS